MTANRSDFTCNLSTLGDNHDPDAHHDCCPSPRRPPRRRRTAPSLTGCPWHDVKAMLREVGLRPTRQRMALGWILFGKGDRHLTAEALYEEASRAKVPVSLATIYNTLHQFTEVGLLRQVPVDGSKAYFDTNASSHHHFFVEGEDELLDIPGARSHRRQDAGSRRKATRSRASTSSCGCAARSDRFSILNSMKAALTARAFLFVRAAVIIIAPAFLCQSQRAHSRARAASSIPMSRSRWQRQIQRLSPSPERRCQRVSVVRSKAVSWPHPARLSRPRRYGEGRSIAAANR